MNGGSFLEMGGYAAFVWPSYGAAALLLAGFAVLAVRAVRQQQKRLADLENRRHRGGESS